MKTLSQFIEELLREPREHAFAERLGAPDWRFTSSTRMLERAIAIAYALRDAGVASGDRVALLSNNRVDWIAADIGILLAGCVAVPVFPTIASDQLRYIVNDSSAVLAFVESERDAESLREVAPNLPRVIAFEGTGPTSLAQFEARGAALAQANPAARAEFLAGVTDESLAVLIYTSGTTGTPKGVMLTHRNLVSNVVSAFTYGLDDVETAGKSTLAVLPFAHIFEHTDLLGSIFVGYDIYVTQPDYFLADLQSVRPFAITIVPRIFERLLGAIIANARAAGGERAAMVPRALEVGRAYMDAVGSGREPDPTLAQHYAMAQAMVYPKIKEALGLDQAEYIVCGSASLHRDVALTFAAMGLLVAEGYGLTEASPVVTCSRREEIRIGSVGKPIPGVEVRIAEDGEILVKGPNVMPGYYRGEEAFTSDGWFKTGDIGRFDDDGYMYITDRKKEVFKTTTGKYVAPSRVEAAIRRSFYVGQCLVIGDGQPFPIALVVPEWNAIRADFAIAPDVPTAVIAARPDVQEFMQREVTEKTAELASFEQVRRIALLPRDLTIHDGDLTPSLKVKRRVVESAFAGLIDSAYASSPRTSQHEIAAVDH